MSELVHQDQGGDESLGDRRDFLSRSALMVALMAITGAETSGAADAAQVDFFKATIGKTEIQNLNVVLNEALMKGSVDTASPAFLKLSPGVQGSLKGLTNADIATLKAAQSVIQSHFSLPNADNNTGTIGM